MEKKKTKNKEEIVERKREGKKRSKTKLAEKKNFSKALPLEPFKIICIAIMSA